MHIQMEEIEDLIQQFGGLSVDLYIENDVDQILICYSHNIDHLDYSMLRIKKNMFKDTAHLYKRILQEISKITYVRNDLMEIMPYIDDYLEYYENL